MGDNSPAPESPAAQSRFESDEHSEEFELNYRGSLPPTLTLQNPADAVAVEIQLRHSFAGTFKQLSLPANAMLRTLTSLGATRAHSTSLFIRIDANDLIKLTGCSHGAGRPAIRELDDAKIIKRFYENGEQRHSYEVLMPPMPEGFKKFIKARLCGDLIKSRSAPLDPREPSLFDARTPADGAPGDGVQENRTPADGAPRDGVTALSAQKQGSGKIDTGVRNPHIHEHVMFDVHVHGEKNTSRRMLESIEFRGAPLDEPGIKRLLKFRTCNPKRIALAAQITDKKLSSVGDSPDFDPHGYFFRLIQLDELTPPMTAEEKRQAAKPENEQEADRLKSERNAAETARLARMRGEMSRYGQHELQRRCRAIAEKQTIDFWRNFWLKKAVNCPTVAALPDWSLSEVYSLNPAEVRS